MPDTLCLTPSILCLAPYVWHPRSDALFSDTLFYGALVLAPYFWRPMSGASVMTHCLWDAPSEEGGTPFLTPYA